MFKRSILAALLTLGAGTALAQESTRPTPTLAADAAAQSGPYCVVTGTTFGSPTGRMTFYLSYGENAPKPPENQLLGEQQRVEALRTPADMLNYLAARGWVLVASTVTTRRDDQLVYQYVLRKQP